jgi:hypothetical protein
MDSLDKGAGWDAADGPISNMSAKGVTGNQLPNQQEIGGRSGEGRTGKSHGQIVEETAEGKGGRETPTRLTPSPFEEGSVEDTSTESPGGSTGGGKLSGFAGEGLRGPTPPQLNQKMARLSGQQAQIRQKAEAIALRLRKMKVSTGELETSIAEMRKVEQAAGKRDGIALRQTHSRAIDALRKAKKAVSGDIRVFRQNQKLPKHIRDEITSGYKENLPEGYEEMAADYFRALAEKE